MLDRLRREIDTRVRMALAMVAGGALVGVAGGFSLTSLPPRLAIPFAVGPTLGCIYAVFDGQPGPTTQPRYVIRLPLRRSMTTGPAWVILTTNQDAAVVFADDGAFLGAGRTLGQDRGRLLHGRRDQPPGRFVQRPPEDFRPPGG